MIVEKGTQNAKGQIKEQMTIHDSCNIVLSDIELMKLVLLSTHTSMLVLRCPSILRIDGASSSGFPSQI